MREKKYRRNILSSITCVVLALILSHFYGQRCSAQTSCPKGCVCDKRRLICHGWENVRPPDVSDTEIYELLDLSSDDDGGTEQSGCSDLEQGSPTSGGALVQGAAGTLEAQTSMGDALDAGRLPAAWLGNGGFSWLRVLRMRGLRLRLLHKDAFRNQLDLRCVDLCANHLVRLNVFTWQRHTDLTTLLLSGNKGLEIPGDAPLLYSRSLEILHLSDCDLTTLNVSAFEGMPKLKKLNLSKNKMKVISAMENHPTVLVSLDLRGNNMSFMDIALAGFLRRIREVQLSGNPWKCNCNLQKTWAWVRRLDKSKYKTAFEVRCSYTNQSWDEVFKNEECKTVISTTSLTTDANDALATQHSGIINDTIHIEGASFITNESDPCSGLTIFMLVVQTMLFISLLAISLCVVFRENSQCRGKSDGSEAIQLQDREQFTLQESTA